MRAVYKRLIAAAMIGLSLAGSPATVAQQTEAPSAPVPIYDSARMRVAADGLLAILKGEPKEAEVFSPGFLAAVPPEQIRMLSEQIRTQFGPEITGADIEMISANSAKLAIHYSKADVTADATITADGAPTFDGLLITGTKVAGDSLEAVSREFAALPGQASFALVRLDGPAPQTIAQAGDDRSYALGSTFKLFILNELAHQVAAGWRSWSDTVPLTAKSFPSGVMQNWPRDMPVTLATLATQMISISDNTATDQLIATLGREAIEARIAKDGISDPERMLPFLSTVEAFALKSPTNAELRQQFITGSEAAQRRLLHDARDRLTLEKVDITMIAGNTPMQIGQIEWFANNADLVALVDQLSRHADPMVRAVMGVNPGLDKATRDLWKYAGFKGGSEPGVIALAYLLESEDGRRYALVGGWNDPAKAINELAFASLMSRVAKLAAIAGR